MAMGARAAHVGDQASSDVNGECDDELDYSLMLEAYPRGRLPIGWLERAVDVADPFAPPLPRKRSGNWIGQLSSATCYPSWHGGYSSPSGWCNGASSRAPPQAEEYKSLPSRPGSARQSSFRRPVNVRQRPQSAVATCYSRSPASPAEQAAAAAKAEMDRLAAEAIAKAKEEAVAATAKAEMDRLAAEAIAKAKEEAHATAWAALDSLPCQHHVPGGDCASTSHEALDAHSDQLNDTCASPTQSAHAERASVSSSAEEERSRAQSCEGPKPQDAWKLFIIEAKKKVPREAPKGNQCSLKSRARGGRRWDYGASVNEARAALGIKLRVCERPPSPQQVPTRRPRPLSELGTRLIPDLSNREKRRQRKLLTKQVGDEESDDYTEHVEGLITELKDCLHQVDDHQHHQHVGDHVGRIDFSKVINRRRSFTPSPFLHRDSFAAKQEEAARIHATARTSAVRFGGEETFIVE